MSEVGDNRLDRLAGLEPYRSRLYFGFALCAAGLGVALTYVVAVGVGDLFASAWMPTGKEHEKLLGLISFGVELLTAVLLMAGVVMLHRVPLGSRSSWATTLLLAMLGADISFVILRAASSDLILVNYTSLIGFALGWIELWMIAVLAAEAAEGAGRADLTHQTEVLGKLIIWGGFIWLVSAIWLFDPEQMNGTSVSASPDAFGALVGLVGIVLHLLVIVRTTMCCFGLAMEYGDGGSKSDGVRDDGGER